jgi:hypothetical protein
MRPSAANCRSLRRQITTACSKVRGQEVQEAAKLVFSHPEIQIDLIVDPYSDNYQAQERICITNLGLIPVDRISFNLHGLRSWDVHSPDGLTESNLKAGLISLQLNSPFFPGEKRLFSLDFRSSLSSFKDNTPDLFALTDWYPRLNLERNYCSDFEVKVTAPTGWKLGGSGVRDGSHFTGKNIRSFGLVLSKNLETSNETCNGINLVCFYHRGSESLADRILSKARESVIFFQQLIGPYPFPTFTMCPGQEDYGGGSPLATGLVNFHGMPAEHSFEYDCWIVSHELGHQYWWENVLDESSDSWLWRGLGLICDRELALLKDDGVLQRYESLLAEAKSMGKDLRLNPPTEDIRTLREDLSYDWNTVVLHGRALELMIAVQRCVGKTNFFNYLRSVQRDYAGLIFTVNEFKYGITLLNPDKVGSLNHIFGLYGI